MRALYIWQKSRDLRRQWNQGHLTNITEINEARDDTITNYTHKVTLYQLAMQNLAKQSSVTPQRSNQWNSTKWVMTGVNFISEAAAYATAEWMTIVRWDMQQNSRHLRSMSGNSSKLDVSSILLTSIWIAAGRSLKTQQIKLSMQPKRTRSKCRSHLYTQNTFKTTAHTKAENPKW